MKVPRNVLWFEALLYVSLMLDALSVAFQDRTPTVESIEQMILIVAAALGTCRSPLVVGDLVVPGDRRERPRTRLQHWDRVLRSDRGRTLFLLHR